MTFAKKFKFPIDSAWGCLSALGRTRQYCAKLFEDFLLDLILENLVEYFWVVSTDGGPDFINVDCHWKTSSLLDCVGEWQALFCDQNPRYRDEILLDDSAGHTYFQAVLHQDEKRSEILRLFRAESEFKFGFNGDDFC